MLESILNGVRMLHPRRESVFLAAKKFGGVFEPETMKVWREWLKDAGEYAALDVGAYSGIYSLVACSVGVGSVIGVEPNPDAVDLFRKNVKLNRMGDSITVLEGAVGKNPGWGSLYRPPKKHALTSVCRVIPALKGGHRVQIFDWRGIDVLLTRPLLAIKIDVEGAECDVLRGLSPLLERDRPKLILEANSKDEETRNIQLAVHFGYKLGHLHRLDGRNLIFIPREDQNG